MTDASAAASHRHIREVKSSATRAGTTCRLSRTLRSSTKHISSPTTVHAHPQRVKWHPPQRTRRQFPCQHNYPSLSRRTAVARRAPEAPAPSGNAKVARTVGILTRRRGGNSESDAFSPRTLRLRVTPFSFRSIRKVTITDAERQHSGCRISTNRVNLR